MGGEKHAPWRPLTSLRRGLDAMLSQNIGDGAPGYRMAEIREGTANSCIPPPRIRLRHPHNELANLGHDPRPSELFPPAERGHLQGHTGSQVLAGAGGIPSP